MIKNQLKTSEAVVCGHQSMPLKIISQLAKKIRPLHSHNQMITQHRVKAWAYQTQKVTNSLRNLTQMTTMVMKTIILTIKLYHPLVKDNREIQRKTKIVEIAILISSLKLKQTQHLTSKIEIVITVDPQTTQFTKCDLKTILSKTQTIKHSKTLLKIMVVIND